MKSLGNTGLFLTFVSKGDIMVSMAKWTDEDRAWLRENFPILPTKTCAEYLRRKEEGICRREGCARDVRRNSSATRKNSTTSDVGVVNVSMMRSLATPLRSVLVDATRR